MAEVVAHLWLTRFRNLPLYETESPARDWSAEQLPSYREQKSSNVRFCSNRDQNCATEPSRAKINRCPLLL
jgi:hypothetical protein